MVQTSPTPFEVGRAFVHQYYTLLHQAPHLLHRFYSTDSTFIHGGVDRPGSIEQPAVGPESIARRIGELNLRDCHAKIRQVDSHPTIGNGVVVQVTGELSNNGHPMRRFMQTFVLAPRQPKKYYVQNDIFRYQDEVFDDVSDEDDRSSSQIYADIDKVSNADSSGANVQQSLMPKEASRTATEEEEPQQPLPPRETSKQQQVITNTIVSQQEPSINGLNESIEYNGQQETIQETRQQTKQISTEGASYAGIAKMHPSTGTSSNVNLPGSASSPLPQATDSSRSTAVKQNSNRLNNQQRTNMNYQQNTRNNQRNEANKQDQSSTRRSGSNITPTISNELQVFVGSLPSEFTPEMLKACFSQFGRVTEAKIHTPTSDYKKNYGFVSFDDPMVASEVVRKEHITYNNVRLNVEQKINSQKSYHSRPGGNRGINRGHHRSNINNQRRGGSGGQFRNNSPSFTGRHENYKIQQQ